MTEGRGVDVRSDGVDGADDVEAGYGWVGLGGWVALESDDAVLGGDGGCL